MGATFGDAREACEGKIKAWDGTPKGLEALRAILDAARELQEDLVSKAGEVGDWISEWEAEIANALDARKGAKESGTLSDWADETRENLAGLLDDAGGFDDF